MHKELKKKCIVKQENVLEEIQRVLENERALLKLRSSLVENETENERIVLRDQISKLELSLEQEKDKFLSLSIHTQELEHKNSLMCEEAQRLIQVEEELNKVRNILKELEANIEEKSSEIEILQNENIVLKTQLEEKEGNFEKSEKTLTELSARYLAETQNYVKLLEEMKGKLEVLEREMASAQKEEYVNREEVGTQREVGVAATEFIIEKKETPTKEKNSSETIDLPTQTESIEKLEFGVQTEINFELIPNIEAARERAQQEECLTEKESEDLIYFDDKYEDYQPTGKLSIAESPRKKSNGEKNYEITETEDFSLSEEKETIVDILESNEEEANEQVEGSDKKYIENLVEEYEILKSQVKELRMIQEREGKT